MTWANLDTRRLGPMSLIGAAATGRRRDENTSHSSISQTAASSNFRNDSHPNHRNVMACAELHAPRCDPKASPNRSELVCAPSAVAFSCAAAVGRSCFSDPPPSPSAALLRSLLVSLLMLLACPAASRLVRADLAAYVARVSGRVPSGPRPSPLAWGSQLARYGGYGRYGRFRRFRACCVRLLCSRSPKPICELVS